MKMFYDNDEIYLISKLISSNNITLAYRKTKDYMEKYPNDVGIIPTYVKILNLKRLYQQAEIICRNTLKNIDKDDEMYKKILLSLGITLSNTNKLDDAEYILNKCYQLYEHNRYYIQLKLADIYIKMGNKNKAYNILNVLNNNNKDSLLKLKKSILLIEDGKENEALNILLNIESNFFNRTNEQEKNFYIGKIYYNKNDFKKAKIYLKNALGIRNEVHYRAYFLLAKIKYKSGFIEEAICMTEEVLDYNIFGQGLFFIIDLYMEMREFDNAKKYIELLDDKNKNIYTDKLLVLEKKVENEPKKIIKRLTQIEKFNKRYNIK
ncbi:MAG: tetratricopeptide repeat protein [Bacilli bacterium]|nr:tetratricopeptide repeat protein [Bacilli bacterium]